MSDHTFDRSSILGLALVATAELREPRYAPLSSAQESCREIESAYLRQLHTVANGVMSGLTAHPRCALDPSVWERLAKTSHP